MPTDKKPEEKPKKKPTKRFAKTKRILYPWLKKRQGKLFKTMLAVIGDAEGWEQVESGDKKLRTQFDFVAEKTNKIFPTMKVKLKKYYESRGRTLSDKDYQNIVICRLRMMFKHDKVNNKIIKLQEHPTNSVELKKVVNRCKKILRSGKTYDEYRKL